MTITNYARSIAKALGLPEKQVSNTLELLDSGATIPFIARYRKEATGTLDEVQITQIRDMKERLVEIDKRRASIIDSIEEQGKMNAELKKKLENANSLTELEDLYLPFKPKRKTKASIAIEKGLEPLAIVIYDQSPVDLKKIALSYIDKEKGLNTLDEVLQGARDIVAEWISENSQIRETMRNLFIKEAFITSKVKRDKKESGSKYEIYFDTSEKLNRVPSHRLLAMLRGEEEGFLSLSIKPDSERAIRMLEKFTLKDRNTCSYQVKVATADAYQRLLQPQMETEMRKHFKALADDNAIEVFSTNLRQLLMASPLGQKRILAIDPGFRTGCKVVALNEQGKLLNHTAIYPHPPQQEYKNASETIKSWVSEYQIEAIAIGNGTAGRETEHFVKYIPFDRKVEIVLVNESGASVYSASEVAREEFGDYDLTVRGAVSIGRRLMDPLAELVKIDPKSIGVGQYQHDVNQTKLQKKLGEVVESCVNFVGVELNTASKELLSYISGVGNVLAKNIVEYRNKNGAFKSREELKKVPRFGEKAFEQAAGFLRIHNAQNPLDSSAVHPESYHIVEKMASDQHCHIADLMQQEELRKQIDLKKYISTKVGMPTLQDIMQELAKPGRDPRTQFENFEFNENIHTINDLTIGMVVPGIVTNITNFGCFVDIGVHQDGLVHISHLANKYVTNPNDVVKLRQKVMVKVEEIDIPRKRISLSMVL
jgi:uncharacterized protein